MSARIYPSGDGYPSWENDEYRSAVNTMTELERAHPTGGVGGRMDERDDVDWDDV